jgi:YVTN family beta-propeller protein
VSFAVFILLTRLPVSPLRAFNANRSVRIGRVQLFLDQEDYLQGVEVMTCRPARGVQKLGMLLPCILLSLLSAIRAQSPDQSVSKPAVQQLGPVGEQESKPSNAAPPANSVADPGVIPSRQQITPAGLQSIFESRVYGVSFGAGGSSIYAAVLGQKGSLVYQIDLKSNHMMTVLTTEASAGMQGLTFDSMGQTPILSGLVGNGKRQQSIGQLVAFSGKDSSVIATGVGTHQMGGVSIGSTRNSNGRRLAVVALTFNDEAAVIDLDAKEVEARVKTGIAPFSALVNTDSSIAWVSNWGGRVPKSGEMSAATGPEPNADKVVVDERGVASSGTVTRIDLLSGKVTASIAVGLHPSGLAWDEAHHWLYVANSNSDSISIVDTTTSRVAETINLQPFM